MSGPVIELLGVPAVGKSGLAAALAGVPGTVVVKNHTHRDLPSLGGAAVRACSVLLEDPPPGIPRVRWAAWVARLGAAPAVAARYGADGRLVVFDQGPAYTLGRMIDIRRDPHGNHWWHGRLCATARLLKLLVVLEADPAVLSLRLRGRGKAHRAAELDQAELARYLSVERRTIHTVADALSRAGTRVIHLDTGRLDVAEQVAVVHAALAPRPVRDRSG